MSEFAIYKVYTGQHGRPFERVCELAADDAKAALAEYDVYCKDPESVAKYEPLLRFDGVTLEDPEHSHQYIVISQGVLDHIDAVREDKPDVPHILPGDMVFWLDDYPWQVWGYAELPGEELHVVLMHERGGEHIAKYSDVRLIEETEVIFRCDPDGDVVALMPDEPGSPGYCMCYQHVGQHGDANLKHVLEESRVALPCEYEKLLREMQRMGYVFNLECEYDHWCCADVEPEPGDWINHEPVTRCKSAAVVTGVQEPDADLQVGKVDTCFSSGLAVVRDKSLDGHDGGKHGWQAVVMPEPRRVVVAEFCEYAYWVTVLQDGEVVHEYRAGNSKVDSQVYLDRDDPAAVSMGKLKQYAIKTALEMAAEHDATFDNTADYRE